MEGTSSSNSIPIPIHILNVISEPKLRESRNRISIYDGKLGGDPVVIKVFRVQESGDKDMVVCEHKYFETSRSNPSLVYGMICDMDGITKTTYSKGATACFIYSGFTKLIADKTSIPSSNNVRRIKRPEDFNAKFLNLLRGSLVATRNISNVSYLSEDDGEEFINIFARRKIDEQCFVIETKSGTAKLMFNYDIRWVKRSRCESVLSRLSTQYSVYEDAKTLVSLVKSILQTENYSLENLAVEFKKLIQSIEEKQLKLINIEHHPLFLNAEQRLNYFVLGFYETNVDASCKAAVHRYLNRTNMSWTEYVENHIYEFRETLRYARGGELCYKDNEMDLFRFCRNICLHCEATERKHKEVGQYLHDICPDLLCRVHEALVL